MDLPSTPAKAVDPSGVIRHARARMILCRSKKPSSSARKTARVCEGQLQVHLHTTGLRERLRRWSKPASSSSTFRNNSPHGVPSDVLSIVRSKENFLYGALPCAASRAPCHDTGLTRVVRFPGTPARTTILIPRCDDCVRYQPSPLLLEPPQFPELVQASSLSNGFVLRKYHHLHEKEGSPVAAERLIQFPDAVPVSGKVLCTPI